MGDHFDISLDPVRMVQLAAGALLFLRGDVSAARQRIERSYSLAQVRESLRLPPEARPYYTPGFALALALRHQVRVRSLDGAPPALPHPAPPANPIRSDTGELAWYTAPAGHGLVTVDTARSQALIGFIPVAGATLGHLAVTVTNEFCAITLSALDGEPIARAARLLLTTGGRVENTGQQWNAAHTAVTHSGGPPTRIEPVAGQITLRNLAGATTVLAQALDGAGRPLSPARSAEQTAAGWVIALGNPATTWYEIYVQR